MSVPSGDLETTSANTQARTPLLRLLPFAVTALLTVCVSAFSLYLAPVVLMAASQALANSPGGPVWP
jgi:hypothetical protein